MFDFIDGELEDIFVEEALAWLKYTYPGLFPVWPE